MWCNYQRDRIDSSIDFLRHCPSNLIRFYIPLSVSIEIWPTWSWNELVSNQLHPYRLKDADSSVHFHKCRSSDFIDFRFIYFFILLIFHCLLQNAALVHPTQPPIRPFKPPPLSPFSHPPLSACVYVYLCLSLPPMYIEETNIWSRTITQPIRRIRKARKLFRPTRASRSVTAAIQLTGCKPTREKQ